MTAQQETYEPIPVVIHNPEAIAPRAVPASGEPEEVTCATLVLTAQDPVQQLLPVDPQRAEAIVLQPGDNDIVIAHSKGEAQAVSNSAAVQSPASINANGSQNSPAGGQVIASAFLPAGIYTVSWTVSIGGTTSGTEANNFQLLLGATVIQGSQNGSTTGIVAPQIPVTIVVPAGGATLSVQAIIAGTAASVYRAQFAATPVSRSALSLPNPSGVIMPAAMTAPLKIRTQGRLLATAQAFPTRVGIIITRRALK
jgi:hypothetical protein